MNIKRVLLVGLSFVMLPVGTVLACTHLFDNFNSLPNKATDPNANWYVIQSGNYQQIYDYVADGSSTTLVKEGSNSVAKLSLHPDNTPDDYQNAELSDVHTGWVYGTPLPWKPTKNHPVVITAKIKWGDNYNLDGSGGAVGSSGLWLWNVPIDYVGEAIQPLESLGISWSTQGSALSEGLAVMTMQSSYPTSVKSVAEVLPNFNLNEWNDLKIVWKEVGSAGNQRVMFYLNGTLIDSVDLPTPMGTLAMQIWNDNQLFQLTGGIAQNPTESQDFFVDKIKVKHQ